MTVRDGRHDPAAGVQQPRVWDKGLQPERTALAWQRCGLSLAGCALILVAIDKQRLHPMWFIPSLAVLGLALWLVLRATRRYRDTHEALTGQRQHEMPDGRMVLAVTLACVVLGIVALMAWASRLA